MKTRFTVIIVGIMLAAAVTVGSAQDAVIGVMAGGTYSDFSHPDTPSKWGFSGGLFGGVETYRTLNLFEVSYTQKGGKSLSGNNSTSIDYIDIALTAGGLTKSHNGSGGRAYAGFSVAFPVSCSSTDAALGGAFCDNKGTEWALPVGIMLGKWNRNGGFVGIDARYSIPLSDASLGVYNNTWLFRFVFGRLR